MKTQTAIRSVQGRLQVARAMRWTTSALLWSTSCGVAAAIALRLAGWADAAQWVLLLPIAVAAIAWIAGRYLRAPGHMDAAIALDTRLELNERVSSAIWLASSDSEAARCVCQDADRRLSGVSRADLQPAFAVERPRVAYLCIAVLAVAYLTLPVVPYVVTDGASSADTRRASAREVRRIRTEARKLAAKSEELERVLKKRGMEEARLLAKKIAEQGRKIAANPASRSKALAQLSKLSDEVRRQTRLRTQGSSARPGETQRPFETDDRASRLSELARQLDRLDTGGFCADLNALKDALDSEAEARRAGERGEGLSKDALAAFERHAEEMRRALKELQQRLAENPALAKELQAMTAEQLALLEKIRQELARLSELCKNGKFGDCSASDLEGMAQQLAAIDAAALQKILESLQGIESLEALQAMLSACRGGMCSGGSQGSGISGLIARLGRGGTSNGSQVGPKASNDGGRGRASGGQSRRGDAAGAKESPERVRGRLDPRGRLGPRVPFTGIPKEEEAKQAFDSTVGRAVDAAEEALGHDRFSPDAKPYVRRYFEALKSRKK